ncbi:hypothetical protein BSKO_04673 [Bryopsis sp. KO-2023]|nr:hypothetical protein BSKO_04673 [Bryopsis sp. KO-2023]
MDFGNDAFADNKEEKWPSAGLDSKPAPSSSSGQIDWFLKADWKPASPAIDPPLINCSLCNRIVLLDRFQQHSCQLRPTLKREKAEVDCCPSVRHNRKGRNSQERTVDAVPRRRERARQSKTSTGSQEGESNGRRRQGKRKRGPACAPREFCYGNSGVKAQWQSGRQQQAPGQKTRKLKDIIKNGPTVFPPVSLSRVMMGIGVDLGRSGSGMVEPLEGQLQNCMVVLGWKGPGAGSPSKRAKGEDGKRGLGKGALSWWEEWGHLFENGVFGFPASVRRQRSPIPVRRSRYPSLESNGDGLDPDMLLGSPSWYTSAFEPLGDTFGSLTVFGFG